MPTDHATRDPSAGQVERRSLRELAQEIEVFWLELAFDPLSPIYLSPMARDRFVSILDDGAIALATARTFDTCEAVAGLLEDAAALLRPHNHARAETLLELAGRIRETAIARFGA
jgi:hypothetical protein